MISVTRQSCLLYAAHVSIRRVCHPLLAWSPLGIWLILNFFLEYWAFSPKLSPRPPLLAAICDGLLNNSTVQSGCQYPRLSTIQSEPCSATSSTTSSPGPSGTHKTPRPFLSPQKYVQHLITVAMFCIKQALTPNNLRQQPPSQTCEGDAGTCSQQRQPCVLTLGTHPSLP